MAQGTSFLNARAYAYMHRAHHAFSDTENDPHSPHYYKNVVTMMIQTAKIYYGYVKKEFPITKETKGYVPEWKSLEELGDTWGFRIGWIVFYSAIYLYFLPPDYWWVALIAVPMHSLMGPMHGAIVNWCGHKYGYSNFDNKDYSKNTLLMDFLMMGELYQNNHHTYPRRLNFAVKWWEFDPTYWITKVLKKLHIIKLST
jgi:stearoyl-CoA desaturase (delta-9 desaturase)